MEVAFSITAHRTRPTMQFFLSDMVITRASHIGRSRTAGVLAGDLVDLCCLHEVSVVPVHAQCFLAPSGLLCTENTILQCRFEAQMAQSLKISQGCSFHHSWSDASKIAFSFRFIASVMYFFLPASSLARALLLSC